MVQIRTAGEVVALSLLLSIPVVSFAEANGSGKSRTTASHRLSQAPTQPPPCFTCHAFPRGTHEPHVVSPRQPASPSTPRPQSSTRYLPDKPLAVVPHSE